MLAAVLTSSAGRNAVAQTFEFPRIDGGRHPELGDTFVPSTGDREEENWRGG